MDFNPPLIPARLLRRYKRFLADVLLDDGTETTAHCPNPGAMMGLARPGARVWLQHSANPKRKLAYTFMLEELEGGGLAGINTNVPNNLVAEALAAGQIEAARGYETIRPEVKYGAASRIDFLAQSPGKPDLYIEVKNVHLMRQPGLAEFPDCVTTRGAKHLDELVKVVAEGHRALMLYVIQMDGPERLTFAADLDPRYAAGATRAAAGGVDMIAHATDTSTNSITLSRPLPVHLP